MSFTNFAIISGKIITLPSFSHQTANEKFLSFFIQSFRLSNTFDQLPIIISEKQITTALVINANIKIFGQYRSYNNYSESQNKLSLNIYAKNIQIVPPENFEKIKHENEVYLNGNICKKTIYRTTPLGKQICDIILAVNRSYNKSDYIPCIAWGEDAKYCSNLQIGTKIKIFGRIQSRDYSKKLISGDTLKKTAYEVSISKIYKD